MLPKNEKDRRMWIFCRNVYIHSAWVYFSYERFRSVENKTENLRDTKILTRPVVFASSISKLVMGSGALPPHACSGEVTVLYQWSFNDG
jgi:hypothetical protein